jgi:FlaA1/EpsC-like NDP-sugar epimerase
VPFFLIIVIAILTFLSKYVKIISKDIIVMTKLKENSYNKTIKSISKWLLGIIFLVGFSFCLLFQLEEPYEIVFIIIGFIIEIIFFPMVLNDLIIESINEKIQKRLFMAFGVNLLFMLNSSIFIISDRYNNSIVFQIFKVLTLLIIAIRICKTIEVNKNNDFSYLKSTNLIMVAIIGSTIYLLKLHKIPVILTIENDINFYYILPILLIQGIYELLDRRTK